MFVQVIKGRTDDSAGPRRQLERWQEELRPGAIGFEEALSASPTTGHSSPSLVSPTPPPPRQIPTGRSSTTGGSRR